MKILVTGAGGFIGGALARGLLQLGHQVRGFQRGSYRQLEEDGIEVVRGDLADQKRVSAAVEGCDCVFHVGAIAAVSGPYSLFHRTNVTGTDHVIEACRRYGIQKLIYTSSPSVVFDGRDQQGIDESAPYPDRYLAHYPRTKAMAERAVLAANCATLATIALRPHLVWGPGDRHLVPRIVERARAGKLKLIKRAGTRIDATYIDNVIDAHIAAFDSLSIGSTCSGKTYFIANDEPMAPHQLIGGILQAAGLDPVEPTISPATAWALGAVLEWVHRTGFWSGEPLLTRFIARQLATSHWFDLSAARRDLGWEPRISTEQGLQRRAKSFSLTSEPVL